LHIPYTTLNNTALPLYETSTKQNTMYNVTIDNLTKQSCLCNEIIVHLFFLACHNLQKHTKWQGILWLYFTNQQYSIYQIRM